MFNHIHLVFHTISLPSFNLEADAEVDAQAVDQLVSVKVLGGVKGIDETGLVTNRCHEAEVWRDVHLDAEAWREEEADALLFV